MSGAGTDATRGGAPGPRPSIACSRKERQPSVSSSIAWSRSWAITGLKTLSSKLPCEPANATDASYPNTCVQTIVIISDWVGFTLPGMMELPGSFSGSRSSPSPARGPDPSQRTSLAIFMRLVASVRIAPDAKTVASCPASAWNLFGAVTNGSPVRSDIRAAARTAKSGWAFRPVPTAVPPSASSYRPGRVASIRARSPSSIAT